MLKFLFWSFHLKCLMLHRWWIPQKSPWQVLVKHRVLYVLAKHQDSSSMTAMSSEVLMSFDYCLMTTSILRRWCSTSPPIREFDGFWHDACYFGAVVVDSVVTALAHWSVRRHQSHHISQEVLFQPGLLQVTSRKPRSGGVKLPDPAPTERRWQGLVQSWGNIYQKIHEHSWVHWIDI